MHVRRIASLFASSLTTGLLACTAQTAPRTPIPAAHADVALAAAPGKQKAVFAGGVLLGHAVRL